MRLIDADALLIEHANNGGMVSFVLRCVIDSAPTIEPPAVRGHYIDEKECSECGAPPNRYEMPSGKPAVNWCWNCGAKMEETE